VANLHYFVEALSCLGALFLLDELDAAENKELQWGYNEWPPRQDNSTRLYDKELRITLKSSLGPRIRNIFGVRNVFVRFLREAHG
jgi:hypothetical protein